MSRSSRALYLLQVWIGHSTQASDEKVNVDCRRRDWMMAGRKRIVVVGGGVAGTTVAHGFDTDAYDLTLVDPYVH